MWAGERTGGRSGERGAKRTSGRAGGAGALVSDWTRTTKDEDKAGERVSGQRQV